MIRQILHYAGYVVAHLPRCVATALCYIIGIFFFIIFRKRRTITFENLAHAFPEKTRWECYVLAFRSSVRMIELGMLAIALPYLSKRRLRQSFQVDESGKKFIQENSNNPVIILLPHFSQMEAMTIFPLLLPQLQQREIGAIYRPFRNRTLEKWIKDTRERYGIQLIPRGKKLFHAMSILKRNGIIVVLFDQNAQKSGVLTSFFGRLASTTNLPNLLYKKFRCPVYMLFPRRTGFFQATCSIEKLPLSLENNPDNTHGITSEMNFWLEQKLRQSPDICCDWLWVHNRWNIGNCPNNWLDFADRKWIINPKDLKSKIQVTIRLPNWLGDIVMSIPFLRAIRETRPDADITLLARPQYIQFLQFLDQKYLHCADRILPLSPLRRNSYAQFWKQLLQYRALKPDFLIVLFNGLLSRCLMRLFWHPKHYAFFELEKDQVKANAPVSIPHQMDDLLEFARRMGFPGNDDRSPLLTHVGRQDRVGLICGSQSQFEKRWPVEHWIELIQYILDHSSSECILFGTKQDRAVTDIIKAAFTNNSRVVHRAGKTDLCTFFQELATCRYVIGNDTGGLHLANAQGTPTVAIFGPTNSRKSCPGFAAPTYILQSPNPHHIASLSVKMVLERLIQAGFIDAQ